MYILLGSLIYLVISKWHPEIVNSREKAQSISSGAYNLLFLLKSAPKQKSNISINVVFPRAFLDAFSPDSGLFSANTIFKPGLKITGLKEE
jgi:hypothetical protein